MAVFGQLPRHRFRDEESDGFYAWSSAPWKYAGCDFCGGLHATGQRGGLLVTPPADSRTCECGTILSRYNKFDLCSSCERLAAKLAASDELNDDDNVLNTKEDAR